MFVSRPFQDLFGSIRSAVRLRTRIRSIAYRISPPGPKPLILTYHRVADEPVDPCGIFVSPSHFEEQLCVLRRTRHVFSLVDFVAHFFNGTLPANAVALTFDDGYVDNLIAGKPRLAHADVPATVFLATGYLDRPEPFWWDELAHLVLLGKNPQHFELVFRDKSIKIDFGPELPTDEGEVTTVGPATKRLDAFWTIWKAMRRLQDEERRSTMITLRSIFRERDECNNLGRAMTSEEVRALVTDGLVTIGAHTVTHPVLAGLEVAACRREITESKLTCEALVGAPVVAFAYPYGDFDTAACEAVKAAGLSFACSTQPTPVVPTSDHLALPRVYAPNLGGDAFEEFLGLASARR